MAHKPHKETGIFINEVSSHQRRYHKVLELTHSTTKAAGVMLLGAIVALVVANTAAHGGFTEFWHTEVSFGFGSAHAEMSLAHIINDVLMAIFFLLVGLEIKYEMTVGELTDVRQAILPVAAAIGGSTLAVADDIVAILVIAVFYGHSPSMMWLAAAAVVMVVLVALNRTHVYSLVPYLLVGAVLWYCIFMSGVHSTIAGVLLAFAIPSRSHVRLKSFASWSGQRVKEAEESYVPDEPVIGQTDYLASVTRLARVSRQVVPPATRLERRLYPWVYFAILPLFALTNADVAFIQVPAGDILSSPIFLGVFFGLVIGKPAGIMLMSFIIVKTKLSTLPENVNWSHMLGAALLGGVGFTMSIFVANLAFADAAYVMVAKVAILAASLVAGVLGFTFLFFQAKAATRRGQRFEMELPSANNRQSHAAHEAERRYKRELIQDENE